MVRDYNTSLKKKIWESTVKRERKKEGKRKKEALLHRSTLDSKTWKQNRRENHQFAFLTL